MKTQQPTYKVSIFAPPFALIRSSFLLRIELLSSSRTFGLALYHILASTSLLLNTAVGYQSLSSLYAKRSLWN